MQLPGKVALITGAGSGIGRTSALLFAREGARVLAVDLRGDAAEETAAQVAAAGGEARAFAADVTQPDQMEAAVAAAVAAWGRVDIFYANAGLPMSFTPIEEVSLELFDRLFAVNVRGAFLGVKSVVPQMKKQRGGVILFTASTAATRPRPGLSPYNATKGAILTLTRSLAAELAPHGIRVNCISPVATDTPMLKEFMGPVSDEAEGRRRFIQTIPLGRLNTPEDIARAALYLASDAAAMVTGLDLLVDGGRNL